ncbi:DNA repair protein RecO [Prochlorococcus sp. MIT 1223]|uniref:DNA repair protein RecO n=1 Tax=Prochlorococcus sp. MIT 1223 TaxID=3096217 RepID=UPI002A74CD4C|nr:DNA repair protein RecO [Prochlorococcus sp. MIT 1223]
MTSSEYLKGLSLKVSPLGENDRLLTFLSDSEGITRLAIPGARKPKSSLAAAAPLTFLELQVVGKRGLKRVRQMKIIKSFSNLGKQLETLAAAQVLSELCLLLIANNDPQANFLSTVLIHLERLEEISYSHQKDILILANCVQSCAHLLALGGYSLPIQVCSQTGRELVPPIGNWEWRCSFMPDEGFIIGSVPNALIQLNPSELALLQRLLHPDLPRKKNGEIMGPKEVWLKLLSVIEGWTNNHLPYRVRSLKMLKEILTSHQDVDTNK